MIDFEDELKGYSAIIYVMENSKSVVVHFGGFDDILEARNFSKYLMHDLGIENLFVPENKTIH
mgnify:CR=1 FL=1|tara:strand:+ start:44 stop:232 length:189 start_codon:yes stop_codon:yes gene_type:complete